MPIIGLPVEESTMIVGSTTLYTSLPASGWLPVTYNASAYSHSTVFVIYATTDSSFTNLNAPPLTTHFTPLGECADRWMLAGGQVVTFTREVFASETPITSIAITSQTQNAAIWTLSQTRPATPSLTSLAAASTSSLAIGDATAPVITSSAALLPRSDYIFQNSTVFSVNFNGTATDPSYRMCQPFRLAPTYSPGICPSGQTVAEVTAFQVVASTGYRTFWQASCCRSGMTFGPEFYAACVSTFSTPLQALVLISTAPYGGATISASYEYTTTVYLTSARTWSTSKISSTTALSTGLAVADPVVIAWQIEDFRLFPSDYATSLARKIGVTLPTTGSDAKLPSDAESPGISTGAKAGIGVGIAVGVLAILVAVVLLRLKKRRKAAQAVEPQHTLPEMADQDQDLAKKKWWAGGIWRSEADAHADPQELESKTVHVVPGPPAELDGAELRHPNETGRVVYPSRDRSDVGI